MSAGRASHAELELEIQGGQEDFFSFTLQPGESVDVAFDGASEAPGLSETLTYTIWDDCAREPLASGLAEGGAAVHNSHGVAKTYRIRAFEPSRQALGGRVTIRLELRLD